MVLNYILVGCPCLKSLSDKLKNNPKKFCDFLSLTSKTKRVPEVITYRSKAMSAKDPSEKASLFNEFFSTVFSAKTCGSVGLHSDVVNPDELMEISTSHNEVKDILSKLDVNKATGVDGIPARMCAEELSYPLTLLFNLSFGSSRVPSLWKKANVTAVFKSDAKDVVENYRSISLLSIPSKYQKKIVHNAIYSHVAPYLSDWQHGFVRGRSCVTQLVLSHHHCSIRPKMLDYRWMWCSWILLRLSTEFHMTYLCRNCVISASLELC